MFNFMKWRWLYLAISALVIIPGLVSLAVFGLKLSLDFTGGTLIEIRTMNEMVTTQEVSEAIGDSLPEARVTEVAAAQFQIKGQTIDNDAKNQLLTDLDTKLDGVVEQRFETLGPSIGRELIIKTLVAIGISFGVILLYLARQFTQLKYGFFAILAMVHDSLVLLGIFSLLGHFFAVEVDVLFVTALLTALSFSVHDTIVVYDRIRELQKLHRQESRLNIINAAIMQTITRSLNNSITVIVMLLALVVLGGVSIKWFAVALLIGAITGTYSSTFVAVPLLYSWEEISGKIMSFVKKLPLPYQRSRTT